MAKARTEKVVTAKVHLELDHIEASVLLAVLEDSRDGFESTGDIAEALVKAGIDSYTPAPHRDVDSNGREYDERGYPLATDAEVAQANAASPDVLRDFAEALGLRELYDEAARALKKL